MEIEIAPRPRRSAGRRVADIAWPRDVVLVAVERGDTLIVPRGDMTIQPGRPGVDLRGPRGAGGSGRPARWGGAAGRRRRTHRSGRAGAPGRWRAARRARAGRHRARPGRCDWQRARPGRSLRRAHRLRLVARAPAERPWPWAIALRPRPSDAPTTRRPAQSVPRCRPGVTRRRVLRA